MGLGYIPGYYCYGIVKDIKGNYVMTSGYSNNGVLGTLMLQDCTTQKTFNGFVSKIEPKGNYSGIIYASGMVDGTPCDCVLTVAADGSLQISVTPSGVNPAVVQPHLPTDAIFPDTGGAAFWGSNMVWGENG